MANPAGILLVCLIASLAWPVMDTASVPPPKGGSKQLKVQNGCKVSNGYKATVSPPARKGGQCRQTVSVSGKGIKDEIIVGCSADTHIVAKEDLLVVGEVVYSDSPNTLVVVRSGNCELRTYEDGEASGSNVLNKKVCKELKKTMDEIVSSDPEDGDSNTKTRGLDDCKVSTGNDDGYKATVSPPARKGGQCRQTVSVSGKGIKDDIIVGCSADTHVVITEDLMVVGDVVYSDSPNTIVVVHSGSCELKTFEDGEVERSNFLNKKVCNTVKKAMDEIVRNAQQAEDENEGDGEEPGDGENPGDENNDFVIPGVSSTS